ncbi:LLM class flavin-dependent oxidoreductase [Amycolatopsis acidiphila]|uniref:LLM class flavin-dependent oxidoreductase n=1 Tax=Amycolatopsis acidiphila TaxID=715473 RepID=A0A558AL43_9PSEU|nr:LLM class flavin-dependent oxidoreductase [Amycolatopsis acidiphila]TVT24989.1 LLM class flavin-dependent oxidoreductase [Amycolatopsis acidiphila]UIJ57504.1 LLM class flavin-dependent oxidoreductase [Amycolatopsis acidiphila]GHG96467.1 luciferase [Amycolatopsis acidiphila]
MTQDAAAELEEYRRQHVPLYNEQKLKLGLFGTNCSEGLTMTTAETTYEATWEHTLKVAQRADAIGMEILVPVARWKGFGGSTNFNGTNFDTYTWAAGLTAKTENIMVASTSHLPTVHPLVAAKASATIDHISAGRFALNLVMGWFTPEMEMFGAAQREHDDRYEFGTEWIEVVKRLWTEDAPFDFDGRYVHVKGGVSLPKPVQKPRPVLLNAGNSPAGIDFSAKHVDFNFATIDTLENAQGYAKAVRDRARSEYRRDLGVMTYAFVICRDTEEEAQQVKRAILEAGDYEGAKNLMAVLGMQSASFSEQIRVYQERFILGWGGYPIIGTPEQVVDELQNLSDVGMDGAILGFLDYHEEMKYFDDNVMPLLRQAGLRK